MQDFDGTLLCVAVLVFLFGVAIGAFTHHGSHGCCKEGFGSIIISGEHVIATAWNTSPNSKLVFQDDGNLVIYNKDGSPIWHSGTYGNPKSKLIMQSDGNLVIYNKNGDAIWSSKTYGWNGAVASFDSDSGLLSINHPRGTYPTKYFGADTSKRFIELTLDKDYLDIVTPDTGMCSDMYKLVMQSDGNLVIYSPTGIPVWNTGTFGSGHRLRMAKNGNLVILKRKVVVFVAAYSNVWESKTSGKELRARFYPYRGVIEIYNSNTQAVVKAYGVGM